MKFSTVYNHHKHQGLDCKDDPSRTKQEFVQEVNINDIVERNREVNEEAPTFDPDTFNDFTDERITDYKTAMDTITGVGELMMQLPARTRARFRNDPVEVLAFVQDPRNALEAARLGLLRPEVAMALEERQKAAQAANPPKPPKGTTDT